ncbi:hypothetical protein Lfu02_63110 [Longispora fulva]|uniref:GNAT superfamily N-acetyltransferase n=1 Tax=Longispora fulva TaxID=619741 RepID=A0A8J7GKQ2_9ACTN|nr:GNAT family N-acetyltransferase [Longispora fulva]MBG6134729.1 GNAT superfamily N-acetyltransferase [Longispora fulva]GIG61939.1 hypothetical protein Lfu02_63110 [Longispora fulva]
MDREIVRAWVDGWVVSRGAAPAVEAPWGFTVDVGLPDHIARHVLPEGTEALVGGLTGTVTARGTWLKLFEDDATVAPWLAPGWLFAPPGFLMSAAVRATATDVPDGYRVRTWAHGGVTRTLVLAADGAFAARGQVAGPPGSRTGIVVVDQVETAPQHRRKGLASLVMRTLANVAAEAGATTGLLGATVEGRALYETLGWATRAPLTSVTLPMG